MLYNHIIVASWAVFILVWAIAAVNVKKDIKGGFGSAWQRFFALRIVAAVALAFVAARLLTGTAHYTNSGNVFNTFVFTPPLYIDWLGALFTVLGVAFAIWARVHLGRNWSGVPSVKEGHELVTSGPYAYVRHPIYTGMILAALGSSLTGTVFGSIVIVVATVIFLARIKKEESIMMELFPNEYPAYRAKTKRLIPFVW